MSRCIRISLLASICLFALGCASLAINDSGAAHQCSPNSSDGENDKAADDKKRPKKLLEWSVEKKDEDKEKNNTSDQDSNDNRLANLKKTETTENDPVSEEKRLDPDRPHLPESSTTVGLGRAMLEAGYTFAEKGSSFRVQTYPEALLRIGMFAEWFEFRIGQSFIDQRSTIDRTRNQDGAQDLYLGVKLALTEQEKCLPESAIIFQMTVPSGSRTASANQVLPGINYDASWEIVKDRAGVEIVLSANGLKDDVGHTYVNLVSGFTGLYNVTKNLEAFAEWDSFYPAGAVGPLTGPQQYAVGGFVYYINSNFEIDIRAGCGLNEHANDFLAGAGFSVRY